MDPYKVERRNRLRGKPVLVICLHDISSWTNNTYVSLCYFFLEYSTDDVKEINFELPGSGREAVMSL